MPNGPRRTQATHRKQRLYKMSVVPSVDVWLLRSDSAGIWPCVRLFWVCDAVSLLPLGGTWLKARVVATAAQCLALAARRAAHGLRAASDGWLARASLSERAWLRHGLRSPCIHSNACRVQVDAARGDGGDAGAIRRRTPQSLMMPRLVQGSISTSSHKSSCCCRSSTQTEQWNTGTRPCDGLRAPRSWCECYRRPHREPRPGVRALMGCRRSAGAAAGGGGAAQHAQARRRLTHDRWTV